MRRFRRGRARPRTGSSCGVGASSIRAGRVPCSSGVGQRTGVSRSRVVAGPMTAGSAPSRAKSTPTFTPCAPGSRIRAANPLTPPGSTGAPSSSIRAWPTSAPWASSRATRRRSDDLPIADVPQGARHHDHVRTIGHGLGGHGLELQPDAFTGVPDHGVGGGGARDTSRPPRRGTAVRRRSGRRTSWPDRAQTAPWVAARRSRRCCSALARKALGSSGVAGVSGATGGASSNAWAPARTAGALPAVSSSGSSVGIRVPDVGAGTGSGPCVRRADGAVGGEIAGGAGRAGQYHGR